MFRKEDLMKRRRTASIAALFIVGTLIVGCSATEVNDEENKVEEIVIPEEAISVDQDKAVDESEGPVVEAAEVPTDNIIEITGHEYSFDPEEITIKKGETITLILKNEGDIVHDWVIKEIPVEMVSHTGEGPHSEKQNESNHQDHSNTGDKEHSHSSPEDDSTNEDHTEHNHHDNVALHVAAEPGETNTIQFVAKQAGTYAYFCSLPGHKEQGMLGAIIVVD
jgi:uncharacterized cupredoxin-like copper-binding protein